MLLQEPKANSMCLKLAKASIPFCESSERKKAAALGENPTNDWCDLWIFFTFFPLDTFLP